jgi:hypothetical protein
MLHYYRIKELCIKLVIETSVYHDAPSENNQIIFFMQSYSQGEGCRLVIKRGIQEH